MDQNDALLLEHQCSLSTCWIPLTSVVEGLIEYVIMCLYSKHHLNAATDAKASTGLYAVKLGFRYASFMVLRCGLKPWLSRYNVDKS